MKEKLDDMFYLFAYDNRIQNKTLFKIQIKIIAFKIVVLSISSFPFPSESLL